MSLSHRPSRRRFGCVHRAALAALGAAVMTAGVASSPVVAAEARAWGWNAQGQVGDGTTSQRNSPVAVFSLSSGVTAVAGGFEHRLAIADGAAKSWGRGGEGQLGNGLNADSSTPVQVTGLTSGVTAVAGGYFHSLAIQNGAVVAWGDGGNGQLGTGSGGSSSTPVQVNGLTTGVTAVAAGYRHSLAIHDGAAKSWGRGGEGQLGNGSTGGYAMPQQVIGLTSGVTAVAASTYHSLAIHNGAAKAWGYNGFGQLGHGMPASISSTPVQVSGLTSGVTAVAGGEYHSLAIQNGNVYAWGSDASGALGNGTSLSSSDTPQMVLDLPTNLVDVAAGTRTSYALSSDGSLWVWGMNSNGQLGLGDDTDNQQSPVQLLAPEGYQFTSIDASAGFGHAVATIALVPEPAGLSVLGLAALAMRRRRAASR